MIKQPKNIILVYGDGSYKGYNLNAFLKVFGMYVEQWKRKYELRL